LLKAGNSCRKFLILLFGWRKKYNARANTQYCISNFIPEITGLFLHVMEYAMDTKAEKVIISDKIGFG
jgi:hypothetical protein